MGYFIVHDMNKPKDKDNITLFKLTFADGSTEAKVKFKDGAARISVKLNIPLTDQNNPRPPSMPSLCPTGKLTVVDSNDQPLSETVQFSSIFFQNE